MTRREARRIASTWHPRKDIPRVKYLFIHQNFPGQFRHLAPALAASPDNAVVAMPLRKMPARDWRGVKLVPYHPERGSTPRVHPWVSDFETKVIRGEACFRAALGLRDQGFSPDVILAHPGWGESLFLKDVWPRARMGIYCEFYYQTKGADVGFDPEFLSVDPGDVCRVRIKNLGNLMHFEAADAAISPTAWQADTFPEPFRRRITVVHDGIDTAALTPDPDVRVLLGGNIVLSRSDEVVTFVNRNLEPYRGCHIFLRALPEILRRRPRARVLIVGADGASYGRPPGEGRTWKEIFVNEVRGAVPDADWARVHFLGRIPYEMFVKVLQLSTVHVYLTYPFVLSWSLLEAMSVGCAIVASDTPPVREAIRHDETGRLVDFFDVAGLARAVDALLDDPGGRDRLGRNARAFVRAGYDLGGVCLPRQMEWVRLLAAGESRA